MPIYQAIIPQQPHTQAHAQVNTAPITNIELGELVTGATIATTYYKLEQFLPHLVTK